MSLSDLERFNGTKLERASLLVNVKFAEVKIILCRTHARENFSRWLHPDWSKLYPVKIKRQEKYLELLMIINRPEFLVREYFLVVETPNPLIHLRYFCGSTANLKVASNQPPCSKDLTVLYLALLIRGSISAVSLVGL